MVTHLGELTQLQDVSLSQTVDDLLSLSCHILVFLSKWTELIQ